MVDSVKRAGELIDKLKAECLSPVRQNIVLGDDKLDEILEAMEELQDICGQIDFAMSLVQIGGVPPLLEMCHPATGLPNELRSVALGLLATVTQNNPYTQNALFNLNSLSLMVTLATSTDHGASLRPKAIHAISCLIRNFTPLEDMFFSGNYPSVTHFTDEGKFVEGASSSLTLPVNVTGPQVIASFLRDSDINVKRKGSFLLSALISQDGLSADKLQGYYDACVGSIVSLLSSLSDPIPEGETGHGLDVDVREIALRTLVSFIEKGKGGEMMALHRDALEACQTSALNRVKSGVDVENAEIEVDLWKDLFTVAE